LREEEDSRPKGSMRGPGRDALERLRDPFRALTMVV